MKAVKIYHYIMKSFTQTFDFVYILENNELEKYQ